MPATETWPQGRAAAVKTRTLCERRTLDQAHRANCPQRNIKNHTVSTAHPGGRAERGLLRAAVEPAQAGLDTRPPRAVGEGRRFDPRRPRRRALARRLAHGPAPTGCQPSAGSDRRGMNEGESGGRAPPRQREAQCAGARTPSRRGSSKEGCSQGDQA